MIEHDKASVTLHNRRFRLRLSTAPATLRLVENFSLSRGGDGRFDADLALVPWTGFAGVTSHTREFFVTTEGPQSPRVEVLEDTADVSRVRYGPLYAASWEIWWTLGLAGETLQWDVWVEVGRKTLPDDEINLLAFDVLPSDEIVQAGFDTGYLLPPKSWFAVPPPVVTYRGNDGPIGVLDRRVRLKFAGDGHETLWLDFAGGYGLSFTSKSRNLFRIVPKATLQPAAPPDPQRLAPAVYRFKSHERFAIGTPLWKENQVVHPRTQFAASVVIRAHDPEPIETMALRTPDPSVADRTIRYHRTHAHGSIAHKWGFAGGWHNTGMPNAHSVSFEYYMHGKAHFYGLHPAIDGVMANSLDAVFERETHPDGFIWQHGFAGRGAFYENNASMLVYLADYVRRTGDLTRVRYGETWAEYILRHTTAEPYLYRCPTSTGCPGTGRGAYVCNWWDVVACGGYDAFINVLTYPGLRDLALLEEAAGQHDAARRYADAAERMRRSFNDLFWDEAPGRYISWVDTEGGRHDYFFTSVNVIAAAEGIADESRRRRVLDSIAVRLRELGYRGFSLPGNLVNIPPDHYNAGDWWIEQYGYPHFYDEFGTYENGGVWPWVSSYYMAALAEFDPDAAYDHYVAILDQYDRDNLQGAGNGYFFDPVTGGLTEGSKQEPYLANTAMTIWGFLTLFGIEVDILHGLRIRPRLPKRLDGSELGMRWRGRRLHFVFEGSGRRVTSLCIDGLTHAPDAPIPPDALRDGSRIEVRVE